MTDPAAKTRDQVEASKLLADRGFGKTLVHVLDSGGDESVDDRPMEVKRVPSDERVIELGKLYNEVLPDDPLAVLYRQIEAEAQERDAKSALPAPKDSGYGEPP